MGRISAVWQTRFIAAALLLAATQAFAQGVGTSAVRGTVRSDENVSLDAVVTVRNLATGVITKTRVHQGRYLIQGLEIGGPYVIEVRRLGFVSQRSLPAMLTLGDALEADFIMTPVPQSLDTMTVVTTAVDKVRAGGGTSITIHDEVLHQLPTLNRNVFDFLPLAPQLSTKVGAGRTGLSAAGANIRFNNFLINGVDERAVNGNVSSGINGGKSIPIDAVKEYQVVIAPYDVRYGDFTGALVNTVTRSGTNELQGSAFTYWRSDQLAREDSASQSQPYERLQTGFSLGGPIRRDRIHFFIAPEIQRLTSPAPGAYVGQPTSADPKPRIDPVDVARFEDLVKGYKLVPGSAGAVTNKSNLLNLFARIDMAIPEWNSRIVAFTSYASSDDSRFTRSARDTFYLSTYQSSTVFRLRLTSFQVYTDLPQIRGGHNELFVSHISDGQDFIPEVKQPVIRVTVPAVDGGGVTLTNGTVESAQGRFSANRSISVKDELSFSGWRSDIVVGAQAETFQIRRGGVTNGYGVWTFTNLDSLARGIPERYELGKDLGGADAPLNGWQYAAYLGSHFTPVKHLELTGGVRADALSFSDGSYNAAVEDTFGRRTDRMPDARVNWSPRLGFTWDMSPTRSLRGGVGLFTGRPPKAWYAAAITSNGVGTGVLRCGPLSTDGGPAPDFVPDYRNAPNACRSGTALGARRGEVDLLDSRLRLAQTLRSSLAIDFRLRHDVSASTEVLINRNRSDFAFVNLNLIGPQRVDPFGRVMYGKVGANGIAVPAVKSGFPEVIDLTNTSRNYSYELSTRVEKRFSSKSSASAAYTWSRVRDVQSPSRVNMTGLSMWGDARAVSGLHSDQTPGISLNDRPHRFVGAVTYTTPWRRAAIDLSFYYVGESGVPFTYLAYGVSRRGDLNADGSNANDPVYVPIDAFEESEIILSGRSDARGADNSTAAQVQRIAAQRTALDRFINRSACLRRQRGLIVQRNSCREPASHTTIAGARHTFEVGGHEIEAGLDLFNVLNLINSHWGLYRVADPRLLEHVGQTPGAPETSQAVFRFDSDRHQWTTLSTESAFQLQAGLRYRF